MANIETVTGPAFAASYLVNGDSSGLEACDIAAIDAWVKREGVASVHGIEDDSERFTWSPAHYFEEFGFSGVTRFARVGLTVCDYICTMAHENA